MIHTYKRAQSIPRHNATIALATSDDSRLMNLAISAKLARIQNSSLPYRMRLAAIVATDTRKGRNGI